MNVRADVCITPSRKYQTVMQVALKLVKNVGFLLLNSGKIRGASGICSQAAEMIVPTDKVQILDFKRRAEP